MARHKMTESDARSALAAGMLSGYELGYDAAVALLERMEEGDGEPGWSSALKRMRASRLESARATIDAMIKGGA